MNKKAIGIGQVIIAAIFIVIFLFAILIISATRQNPEEMLNNVGDVSDNLKLNLDLTSQEVLNIYQIENFFDNNKDDTIRLNIRSNSQPYLNNLIFSSSLVKDEFNFDKLSEFVSYFNGEVIDYKINKIKIDDFYGTLEDTMFICNILTNKEDLQLIKLNNLLNNLINEKIDVNFLRILIDLSNENDIFTDVYEDENSLNYISQRYDNFNNRITILNPDYQNKNSEIIKRFYISDFNTLENNNIEVFSNINDELEKLDLLLTNKQIYSLATTFYIFPCLLFNYKTQSIYRTSGGNFYYIKEIIEEDDSLNDIIISVDDIDMNKLYSKFLYYDSLMFYDSSIYIDDTDELILEKMQLKK